MSSSEVLKVTGYGRSRDAALSDAGRQAAAYYGDLEHQGRTLRAWVEEREVVSRLSAAEPDYVLLTFAVEMEYEQVMPF